MLLFVIFGILAIVANWRMPLLITKVILGRLPPPDVRARFVGESRVCEFVNSPGGHSASSYTQTGILDSRGYGRLVP